MNLEYDDINIKQQQFIEDFSTILFQEKNNKEYVELVFLCIGTDRMTGDSFGPLVGTKLQELFGENNIFNINIYGTLNENICYTNVKEKISNIKKVHKNACIIVIDAALSNEENIGKIFVKKEKMSLGKGLYKAKMEVGDISIKAVVGKSYKLSKYNFSSLQNISLNRVINLSEIVSEGIVQVIKYL